MPDIAAGYKCSGCSRVFPNPNELEEHQEYHRMEERVEGEEKKKKAIKTVAKKNKLPMLVVGRVIRDFEEVLKK